MIPTQNPTPSPTPPNGDAESTTSHSQVRKSSLLRDKLRKISGSLQKGIPLAHEIESPCESSHATTHADPFPVALSAPDATEAVPLSKQKSTALPRHVPPSQSNTVQDTYADAQSAKKKAAKIMIVDDEETNILTVQQYLKREGYRNFVTATDSRETLKLMRKHLPDVLLLDINMPNISGIDILRTLSMAPELQIVPSIILTASTDPAVKRTALELGANDFLTKPVDPNDLIPRVRNALVIKSHVDQYASQAAKLEGLVERRTAELFQSRQQLIMSLARAAEHRDNETCNHVIRVGRFADIIAREIGWSDERAEMIEQAAQLHDVGKIGIPDSILFKPGKLEPQEYDLMKEHCALGKEIIEPYSQKDLEVLKSHARLGGEILHIHSSPMMMMASRIAQTHHERWDGSGYPLGLSGEDIPIEGRITSVADVYDALSSVRPYKKAFPREKCFQILIEGRGSQFDPKMLDAFFRRSDEIIQVQLDFMDREFHN